MTNFNEDEIKKLKDKINSEPVPKNIDHFIVYGLNKGKYMRNKNKKKRIYLGLTTSLLIITFIISIRISPVFASYISNVPGFEKIVNLIRYDQGLQLAVKNNFIQHIGNSDEHENIKLTVDDIIIDETRMVLFYTIENNTNLKQRINISKPSFFDQEGKKMEWGYGYDLGIDKLDVEESYQNIIDIYINDQNNIPNSITLQTKLEADSIDSDSVWEINIPIDKSKFEGLKNEYILNETIEIAEQKIYFNKVTIYPTRIAVEIEYDKNNSKKILGYDDIRIVDEQGREYASANGVVLSRIDENKENIYLQSNYFNQPEELYLRASSIKALDKDKLEVIVDLDKEILLKQPDDNIKLDSVKKTYNDIELTFLIKKDPKDYRHFYDIFSGVFYDEKGNEYRMIKTESWHSSFNDEEYDYSNRYTIENLDYQDPIKLEIIQYPTRINEKIDIKVK